MQEVDGKKRKKKGKSEEKEMDYVKTMDSEL